MSKRKTFLTPEDAELFIEMHDLQDVLEDSEERELLLENNSNL